MSFKENLLKKLEIDRLATRIIASCESARTRHRVDMDAMRLLLELSPYKYQRERDLDLYVKPIEGELKMILVLDNELPLFRSTIKDVVIRRSPRTLEMWSFRTVRKILVDSDIKVSVKGKSVETVRQDAEEQLDVTYTAADIENLALEGMALLAEGDAGGVETTLTLFAALLGYRKPPGYFGLDHTVCFGAPASGPDNDAAFGPLVLYRSADNALAWVDEPLSGAGQQQMDFLRAVASGESSVPVTGDAVFRKLQANVPAAPRR